MKYLLGILLIGWPAFSSAQTIIKGRVTDTNQQPVVGANIYIEDTYDGTASNADGFFEFQTTEDGRKILVFSAVGFQDIKKNIYLSDSLETLDIILHDAVTHLRNLVITADSFETSDNQKSAVLHTLDIVTTAGTIADISGALNTLPGTRSG